MDLVPASRFINGSAGLAYRRMNVLTEEQPTVVEETLAEPRGSLRERWVPLGLVLGGGVWNFFFARLADAVDWDDWWAIPIYFAWGALLAQPLLCAVWGACGPQAWFWRLLIGVAACCYLTLAMTPDGDVLNMLSFLMGIHVTCLVVLLLLRWKFNIVLGTSPLSKDATPSRTSFGLGYLFLWMSVVAVLAGLARILAGDAAQSRPELEELAMFSMMFLAILGPAAWLFLYLIRPARVQILPLVLLGLSIPLATLFAAFMFGQLSPGADFWTERVWPLSFYCLGAMFTVTVVAIVLRWAGYRLYTPASSP